MNRQDTKAFLERIIKCEGICADIANNYQFCIGCPIDKIVHKECECCDVDIAFIAAKQAYNEILAEETLNEILNEELHNQS